MPIDILDGFEDYPGTSTAGVGLSSYWTMGGTNVVSLVAGRVGGQALQLSNQTTAFRSFTTSAQVSGFFAFHHNANYTQSGDNVMAMISDSTGAAHISLACNQARELVVTGPGGVLARPLEVYQFNVWHSLAFAIEIHDSLGSVKIWIDGELIVDLSNVDTKNGVNNASRFYLRAQGSAASANSARYDDVRIDSGTLIQIPEGRVATFVPISDIEKDWTPSTGADNYAMVDELTADSDTTYNSANTVGARDRFGLSQMTFNPDQIYAVMVACAARKEDVATRRIASILDSGGVEVQMPDNYLSTNWTWDRHILELNPDGNIPWTKTAVNALTLGYELIE